MAKAPNVMDTEKDRNELKRIAIVLIILAVILAITAANFVILYVDQKTEINNLRQSLAGMQDVSYDGTTEYNDDVKTETLKITLLRTLEIAGYDIHDLTINSIIEVDSPLASYQILSTGVGSTGAPGGDIAYFYRNLPDGVWKYGVRAQNTPPCVMFDGEKYKVFAHFDCYDYSTNSNTTVGEWAGL